MRNKFYQMSEKVKYYILLLKFYLPFGQGTAHIYLPEVKSAAIGCRAVLIGSMHIIDWIESSYMIQYNLSNITAR